MYFYVCKSFWILLDTMSLRCFESLHVDGVCWSGPMHAIFGHGDLDVGPKPQGQEGKPVYQVYAGSIKLGNS